MSAGCAAGGAGAADPVGVDHPWSSSAVRFRYWRRLLAQPAGTNVLGLSRCSPSHRARQTRSDGRHPSRAPTCRRPAGAVGSDDEASRAATTGAWPTAAARCRVTPDNRSIAIIHGRADAGSRGATSGGAITIACQTASPGFRAPDIAGCEPQPVFEFREILTNAASSSTTTRSRFISARLRTSCVRRSFFLSERRGA
jgi:hypothetical protein